MNTDTQQAAEVLQMFPIFEGVSPEELEQIASHATIEQCKKHHKIYNSGERADRLYFLIKGAVKIARHSDEEREVIKHILHPMAMFGELSLTGEQRRQDYAVCMKSNTQLIVIKTVHLQQLMRRNHSLSMRALHFIGRRLQSAEHRLESLIFKDARERIIEFLKESAREQGKKIGYETLIKHSLTQQDIANITGTSRQTVTSVMNDLRKSNLIYFNRRSILIRDLGKLA